MPASGGGIHAGSYEIADGDRTGRAVIESDLEGGYGPAYGRGEALFLVSGEWQLSISHPGEMAPGGARYAGVIWMPPAMNEVGQVVWGSQMENGEGWLFLHDARSRQTQLVARPGMKTADGHTFVSGGRQRMVVNNGGELAFEAYVAGTGNAPLPGVFSRSRGAVRTIAAAGTPAPGGGEFLMAEAPSINDAGEVVFHARTTSGRGLGVFLWQEGFLTPVFQPDGSYPGDRPGRRVYEAFYPQVDARGRVVFVGRSAQGDGLYRWAHGKVTAIARVGDRLPGIGPLQALDFHYRRPFFLNARGDVAFSGSGESRSGVFLWRGGSIRPVALSGEEMASLGTPENVGGGDGGSGYPGGYPTGGYPVGGYGAGNYPGGPPGAGYGAAPPGYGPPGMAPPPSAMGGRLGDRGVRWTSGGAEGGPTTTGSRAGAPARPTINERRSTLADRRSVPPRSRPPSERGRTRPQLPPQGYGTYPSGSGAPYGAPGPGYYRGFSGPSVGVVLCDDGTVIFPATFGGQSCVVLATPNAPRLAVDLRDYRGK
jgi:hypothetical protein